MSRERAIAVPNRPDLPVAADGTVARVPVQPRSPVSLPPDVQPGEGWTEIMLEAADHISPRAVLMLCAVYGGIELYVPYRDVDGHPIEQLIGPRDAHALSAWCGGERIVFPVARHAIAAAQRAPIIDQILDGRINITEGARILRTSRNYLSQLVDRARRGLPRGNVQRLRKSTHQLDMFGDDKDD